MNYLLVVAEYLAIVDTSVVKGMISRSKCYLFPPSLSSKFLHDLCQQLAEMPESRPREVLDQLVSLRLQLRSRCSLGAICHYKRDPSRIPNHIAYSYHSLPCWHSYYYSWSILEVFIDPPLPIDGLVYSDLDWPVLFPLVAERLDVQGFYEIFERYPSV
jgi:hypothetical protein